MFIGSRKLVPRLIAQISEEDSWEYQEKKRSTISDRFFGLLVSVLQSHPSLLLEPGDHSYLFEVILYLVKAGRTDELSMYDWDDVDVQHFVAKLNRCRLAGWSVNSTPLSQWIPSNTILQDCQRPSSRLPFPQQCCREQLTRSH